jgi:hypothetical protein
MKNIIAHLAKALGTLLIFGWTCVLLNSFFGQEWVEGLFIGIGVWVTLDFLKDKVLFPEELPSSLK